MASVESSFCIGSYADLPVQSVTIAGSAQVVAAGTYYLWDPSAGLSLLAKVQAAMTAAGVAGAAAELLGSGHVRLKSSGAAFTVVWGPGVVSLKTLLGFSADLAGSSSYTAPLKSPLFWSPRKPELPSAPLGVRGNKRYNVMQTFSPYSGIVESLRHGYREYNTFKWEKVDADRVRTAAELGGEFAKFYETVFVPSARWKLYHDASDDPLSTTAFTYDVQLGPYITILGSKGAEWKWDRSRGFEWTDDCIDIIDVTVTVTPEID